MSTPLTRRPDASASGASDALARIGLALRRITVPFPYLAGLAAAARVQLDARVPTMGVFASGRMVANAQFVGKLNDADLNFVVAHELLHLALRTHQRARGSDLMQFNVAHDYIINDVLRHELGIARIPAGGLDMQGARLRSAEAILLELRREARAQTAGGGTKVRIWQPGSGSRSGSGSGQRDGDGESSVTRSATKWVTCWPTHWSASGSMPTRRLNVSNNVNSSRQPAAGWQWPGHVADCLRH
jgi:hypothetical protein